MHIRPFIPSLLRADAVLNAGGALVLLALGGPLRDALGLAAAWPLYVVAALLLANGAELALTARDPRPAMLSVLAAVDFAFAVAVLAYAAVATGAEPWARWALVIVADATLVVGAAKLLGRRGLAPQPSRSIPG